MDDCWEKGSGSAGNSPNWWKSAKEKREGENKKKHDKKGKGTHANAVIVNESNGIHCTPHHSDFIELAPIQPHIISEFSGTGIAAVSIGLIKIHTGKGHKLELVQALLIPKSTISLLSVGRLTDHGYHVDFTPTTCHIHRNNKIITEALNRKKDYPECHSPTLRTCLCDQAQT
ncbi:hypothetical protein K439DRAFT_1544445 [Ramaria rubella]|nr:hypothetical protein K439DRAFT_1544445 [Ramaria rubella]